MAESPRQLAFKDRFVWELEQAVLPRFDEFNDFVDRYVFPDLTTPQPLVLYLSQREFTQLYSAVLTGADLSYPNQSHDVEYLFLQMVGMQMAQLCQAIADCITNSEPTQSSLLQFLVTNNFGGGVGNPAEPVEEGVREENLLPPGYTCTDDLAFGMALAIADGINEAVTEVLEAIEILTNPLEIAAELTDNVPGVGALTSAADVANWIQDTAKEQYDLAWSTSVRDEIACLIWCQFKDTCVLNYDLLWDIYLEIAQESPPVGDTLEDWVLWVVSLPYGVALQTVGAISMIGLIAMRYGGKFGQFVLGIRTLETLMALSADDSSSDWSILCDCAWCIDIDWTLGADGWAKAPPPEGAGILIASGWQYEDIVLPSGEARRTVVIAKSFTSSLVTGIDLLLDFTVGAFPSNMVVLIFITEDSTVRTDVLRIMRNDMPSGTDLNIVWSDPVGQQMDYISLFTRSSFDDSAPYSYSGNILYKAVEICGDGAKPGDL